MVRPWGSGETRGHEPLYNMPARRIERLAEIPREHLPRMAERGAHEGVVCLGRRGKPRFRNEEHYGGRHLGRRAKTLRFYKEKWRCGCPKLNRGGKKIEVSRSGREPLRDLFLEREHDAGRFPRLGQFAQEAEQSPGNVIGDVSAEFMASQLVGS